jgi:sulfite exporter TauE/SafE
MIAFGALLLARAAGVRTGRMRMPRTVTRWMEGAHRAAFALNPTGRAATIGLLTALLPCGWLYAFAFTAAGTGSPAWGAGVMATFWAGTVPLMAVLGAGIRMVTGPLHARLPLLTGLIVTGAGVFTATGRLSAPAMTRDALHVTDGAVPASADDACPLCREADEVRP